MHGSKPLRSVRRKAWNIADNAHALTFSTYRRRPIFNDRPAAELFLTALDKARHAANFDLYAFVVMPDHCHVLLWPQEEEYQMSTILKAIKSPAAKLILEALPTWRSEFVVRTSRGIETRLWQKGGGYDRNITSVKTMWKTIHYIHGNPVRKGLCETHLDWPYSSAGAYHGLPTLIPVDLCNWQDDLAKGLE